MSVTHYEPTSAEINAKLKEMQATANSEVTRFTPNDARFELIAAHVQRTQKRNNEAQPAEAKTVERATDPGAERNVNEVKGAYRLPVADHDFAKKHDLEAVLVRDENDKPVVEYRDANKNVAIEDRGDAVRIHDEKAMGAAVELAKEKFPKGVEISFKNEATEEHKTALLRECAKQGLEVRNPELMVQFERLKVEEKRRLQKDPAEAQTETLAKMDELKAARSEKEPEREREREPEQTQPETEIER